jgi:hypothetical protein
MRLERVPSWGLTGVREVTVERLVVPSSHHLAASLKLVAHPVGITHIL